MTTPRKAQHSMAPTYVGDPASSGLTVYEHTFIECLKAIIVSDKKYIDQPTDAVNKAAILADAALAKCAVELAK